MKKILTFILVVATVLTSAANAETLPSYYPDDGFQRTGVVDAVHIVEGRVVIGDISYQMSKSAVVHSLTAYSVSLARVRQGVRVAFRVGNGRVIEEFWLLPLNYDALQR